MDLLDLREPNKVINSAIQIIEDLQYYKTRELMKINKMDQIEKEKLGNEYIVNVCLVLQQYEKLIDDLEKVRDFASEQLIKIVEENSKSKIGE